MATKTIPQLTALGANVAVDDQLEISDTSNSDASRKVTQAQLVAILGTPASGTLTNCTGLPVSTGIAGLGTGVATFLATPSSANLASAVTGETGSGALVFGTDPTLAASVTVGTASSATGTILIKGTTSGTVTLSVADAAGTWTMKLPTGAGSNGQVLTTNGSGVTSWSTVAGTGDVVGPGSSTDNAIVRFDGTTGKLVQNSAVTIADTTGDIVSSGDVTCVDLTASGTTTLGAITTLGTPGGGTLTNCTGLPVSTGISGLGTGVATALAVNVGGFWICSSWIAHRLVSLQNGY